MSSFDLNHDVYDDILQTRGMQDIVADTPLWKLKISDEEYENLKETLVNHPLYLWYFGMEAAICYAEWWRRDYSGNIPSKEDVAVGIGLGIEFADDLYMAARNALKKKGYNFIHSLKGIEYFRTLLNQGGLPINYIKNNDGNMGNFTRFLKGLVKELSVINFDWENTDSTDVRNLSCVSYLGKAFRNENIYDVSLQIAHAICLEDYALLPYDDSDQSLSELTNSLRKEYTNVRSARRLKPLSLQWRLHISDETQGHLYVVLDETKEISSDSIPGLNISTCYRFDVFVAGHLASSYVRKSLNYLDDGSVENATYSRITSGFNKEILWKGEPVVEIKVRCDNDDRLFLTIAGCYPPNFEYPQVFQMIADNIYSRGETGNSETNVAIFDAQWKNEDSLSIYINGKEYFYNDFKRELKLVNSESDEIIKLENKFTPYTVEFGGNYISWIESSNYKLLSSVPMIRVYNQAKERVYNFKSKYRARYGNDKLWRTLKSSCNLPIGIIDISVELPDGHILYESFYSIGNLHFSHMNESAMSTEILCNDDNNTHVTIEELEGLDITPLSDRRWRISRQNDSQLKHTECTFRYQCAGNPTLKILIAIPFDGVIITDANGNALPKDKILTFDNLSHYFILAHGKRQKKISVSYTSDKFDNKSNIKRFDCKVIEGRVPLSDYVPFIERMFNLYGADSFNRSSSVSLNISGNPIYIRKFVLDSTMIGDKIIVLDYTDSESRDFQYQGDLYCLPVGEDLSAQEFSPLKLHRNDEESNVFALPDALDSNEFIVFSGIDSRRRIIPKYFNCDLGESDRKERIEHAKRSIRQWEKALVEEDTMRGNHWQKVCKAFDLCAQFRLPFNTDNGLRVIAKYPSLLVKFLFAMWLNNKGNVLIQEIDRFEKELEISVHWIPVNVWHDTMNESIQSLPEMLSPIIVSKLSEFISMMNDIFHATLATEAADDLKRLVFSGHLESGMQLSRADINDYKSQIRGFSDTNTDLPIVSVKYHLNNRYYPYEEQMLKYYRVMIEAPMCAAENTFGIDGRNDLFSKENKEQARVANFYRNYFKETYSSIFIRILKYLNKKN